MNVVYNSTQYAIVAYPARQAFELVDKTGDTILDAWIFAGDDRMVLDVWAAGRHVVRDGRHIARDAIRARYVATLRRLKDAL